MCYHNMEENERNTRKYVSVKESCQTGPGQVTSDKEASGAQDYRVFNNVTALQSYASHAGTNLVKRQRAGTSVERRPLMLNRTSQITTKKHDSTIDEETCLKGANPAATPANNSTTPGNSNKTDHLPHSDGALLPFSFNTWRHSALSVVETIRDKLNYFRRTRSLDEKSDSEMRFDGAKKNAQKLNNCYDQSFSLQSLDHTTAEGYKNQNIGCKVLYRNFTCEKNNCDDVISGEPLLKDSSSKNEHDERIELTSDSIKVVNHRQGKISEHNTNDTQSSDWTVLESADNIAVQEKEPVVNASCTGTTLCVPCIGPRKSIEDVFEATVDVLLDKSRAETSDSESLALSKESSPKVVHQQPGNSPSCEKLSLEEVESKNSKVEENESLFSSESNAKALDHYKNNEQKNGCDESLSSDLSTTSSEAIKGSEYNRHNVDQEYVEQHSNYHPNGVMPNTQELKIYSTEDSERRRIDLWNLRNSLEQREVVNFHAPSYGGFDKDSNFRSISISTTGGMTEESPLTTPSSEPVISRERSMSDFDDENRAFIITASGRISPRLPSCHRRRSSGFSSSPEHGFEKSQNTELCVPEKATTTIKATVEYPPPHLYSDDMLSFGEKKLPKNNTPLVSSPPSCHQRRQNFMSSQKWSTLDSTDSSNLSETLTVPTPSQTKKQVMRQMSLPLSVQHQSPEHKSSLVRNSSRPTHSIIRFVADEDIKEVPLSQNLPEAESLQSNVACKNDISSSNAKSRRNLFLSADNHSLDDVFYNDNEASWITSKTLQTDANHIPSTIEKSIKKEGDCCMESQSKQSQNMSKQPVRSSQTRAAYPLASVDTTPVPPTHGHKQRRKYHTKPASVNSSGGSSPVSPSGGSSMVSTFKHTRSVDLESDDSVSSQTSSGRSSRSSSSLKSISRLFRRSNKHHRQRSVSAPLFYGYTMDRDYCVDVETDRIFKEFLCQDSPNLASSSLACGELLPPPSHMVPPPPLNRRSGAQLRGQVLRKQYSDSIAMYYGQRQRRWRFSGQKSDSVNCPIDRGILRRQDRIEEEFDPEEINERLSSTSSRRDSERPDFIPPTVNELKEWRSNSEDRTPVLRQTNSLLLPSFQKEVTPSASHRPTRRVTFKGGQFKDVKTRSYDEKG